jgi:hypothetical protein
MGRDALERGSTLMKLQYRLYSCIASGISIFFVVTAELLLQLILPGWLQQQLPVTKAMSVTAAPVRFLHRPYYGGQTILQRTVSFFDHDKPWYADDGRFVRFDGATWYGYGNTSVADCIGNVSCYDGHNGYDLNLWYEPVLSAAAGKVVRANWYNPLNHNDGFGLWVAIDHGNGYLTAYGHLSKVTVSVGSYVATQQQIGISGMTGEATGPHLHLSVYYLPNWQPTDPFGWTGNYADPNVVPDFYLWVANPRAPDSGSNSTYTEQNHSVAMP